MSWVASIMSWVASIMGRVTSIMSWVASIMSWVASIMGRVASRCSEPCASIYSRIPLLLRYCELSLYSNVLHTQISVIEFK